MWWLWRCPEKTSFDENLLQGQSWLMAFRYQVLRSNVLGTQSRIPWIQTNPWVHTHSRTEHNGATRPGTYFQYMRFLQWAMLDDNSPLARSGVSENWAMSWGSYVSIFPSCPHSQVSDVHQIWSSLQPTSAPSSSLHILYMLVSTSLRTQTDSQSYFLTHFVLPPSCADSSIPFDLTLSCLMTLKRSLCHWLSYLCL
jgi:hypothetical protein